MQEEKIYQPGGGKVYVDNNTDRFGLPIMPKKPVDLIPGPGEYEIAQTKVIKGGYIYAKPQDDNDEYNNNNNKNVKEEIGRRIPSDKEKGIPGPAYYNPVQEPNKISFLFNAAEKWVVS